MKPRTPAKITFALILGGLIAGAFYTALQFLGVIP